MGSSDDVSKKAIGHAAINSYTYKDIRDKGTRSLPIKTV